MKNLFKTKLLALLLSVAGLFCVSSTYAWTIGAGDVYFDNTATNWSDVYIRFGASGWCTVYKMTKLDNNANIYYVNFGGDAGAIDAIQFAAVDGYNVTTGCNTDCGIYNGNVIPNGQKTAYIKADITGGNRLIVATGNTNFCAIEGPFTMPSTVAYTSATLGGKSVTADGTVGYFNPSQNVTFAGTTTLGYGTAPSKDLVHATMNYYLSGSKYSMLSCASNNTHVKSFTKSVTLPSAVGKYTMSTYYKCGGPASAVRTSYYHIVGLTGQNLNFGAVTAGGSLDKTESLTNVWGGDNVNSVSATISGDGTYFQFVDGTISKSIAIADKAGSVDIRFLAPTGGDWDEKSATLTLTMTCDDGTTVVTKTYDLTGKARNDGVTIIKSSKATLLPGPKATLHGYIQYTGCIDITERGFYYSTSPNITTSATKVTSSESSVMKSGDEWECGIPASGNLATNTTYYFRPYVYGEDGVTHLSTSDYTFRTGDACNYQFGDTVYIQVDKSFASDDACALKFQELQTALNFVKNNSSLYNSASGQKVLLHNIVFLVAPAKSNYVGTGTTTTTGGGGTDLSTIIFEDINSPAGASPSKTMIIRSSNPAKQPIIQHPTIRNSRKITFDNVFLTGSKTVGVKGQYDNAVDIDKNDASWTSLVVGAVANADIKFLNCNIYSMGFTCVHVSAYDGVTFENCDIEADLPEGSAGKEQPNTILWGASAKFIKCKNVKFLRNNFRGSHTTSIWLQGVIGFLAMNNVFWNDNDSYNSSYKNNGTFFRLITQQEGSGTTADLNQKIGIYYNTLYIADNKDVTTPRNFDFFRLGSNYDTDDKGGKALAANLGQNQHSTIRFMYNNCYSYDQHSVQGANQSGDYKWCLDATESDWCNSIMYNNYWSMWDGRTANFVTPNTSVCSGNKYYNVNVYEQVCSTAADDPGTLVIKGSGLNLGYHVSSTVDQSGLGAENYYNDRLHASNGADAVRNKDGNWTIGAYQQSEGDAPIETIVWWGDATGDNDNWDNRYNWRKLDGTRVTCVDNLATDLKVIIPAPESDVYPVPEGGITKYPYLPTKFSGERTKISQETVNAGHGISNPSMFAGTIELEYGAAIKGITSLKDDEARRYTEVTNYFDADRSKYLLVGTVVKPFANGEKTATHNIISGDYFLNYTPQVYMRKAELNGETANWDKPFASLEESVDYDKCFAVKVPNQYGKRKVKDYIYYKYEEPNPAMVNDGSVTKRYTFNGWFLNDEVYPEFPAKTNILITNTYPANILVKRGGDDNNGQIKAYNYDDQEFQTTEDDTKEVKSQNAFIFIPGVNNNGYFRITKEMLTDNSTKYKSATATYPYFYIKASNPKGEEGSSSAGIIYDELKSDKYNAETDLLNTVISSATTKPEIYVEMYGQELDRVVVPDITKSIPLGLSLQTAMTVEFSYREMADVEKAELEDRETGEKYDLLKEKPQIALAKGTYSGRFFLNLTEIEEPLPTDVEEENSTSASIDIYGDGKAVIISSSDNVILQSAEITDMAGRTTYVTLKNPHYNKFKIKGVQGLYLVRAIGDIKSETTKVIVK